MHGTIFLLLLLIGLQSSVACPNSCVCKWKNGKQTVECSERGLLIIPEGMDSGTQVLEFSGNNLQTLHKDKFLRMDLINLQRIYLSRCHISGVDDQTFKGLTNLVELDLSGNFLESIPSGAFSHCRSLMRLTLSSNPIKIVRTEGFNQLYFLSILELSSCEIEHVEEGAFQGLHSLEWLRLDGNNMKTLRGKAVLPENLRGVELQGNPWECDCHLLELRAWLQTFTIPQSLEPMCTVPLKFARRPVKSIPATELACLPDISPTTFYLEIGEGKNVSLLCRINAIPEAHISWWFQGQLLQNDTVVAPNTRLVYYVEEGGIDKISQLFIYNTNSEDNGTFICSAENPAGTSQSNFTIRIIIKDEYNYDVPTLPYEFVLIVLSASGVSLVIIFCALILTIIKCNRRSESPPTKDTTLLQESEYSELSKESSNTTLNARPQIYLQTSLGSVTPIVINPSINQTLCYHHQEQNPDLINDTESIGRRAEGDGEDKSLFNEATPQTYKLPLTNKNSEVYHPTDVHLNPIGLLSSTLNPTINPILHPNSSTLLFNHYRTLPYNRASKTQKFRDINYEHFSLDVRYTADGYPARNEEHETQFSDTDSVRSCCSAPIPSQWSKEEVVLKKSVGAQTQTDIVVNKPANRLVSATRIVETLTESPDEGYEGEDIAK